MTRSEFDYHFAATTRNTEGYTKAELAEINDKVFAEIEHLEVDSDDANDAAKNAFADAFNTASIRTSRREHG